uniref:hypothetical protein n=1 Tax=Micromonospora carbonacea TaxID=47853 RepID=UPI003B21A6BF
MPAAGRQQDGHGTGPGPCGVSATVVLVLVNVADPFGQLAAGGGRHRLVDVDEPRPWSAVVQEVRPIRRGSVRQLQATTVRQLVVLVDVEHPPPDPFGSCVGQLVDVGAHA